MKKIVLMFCLVFSLALVSVVLAEETISTSQVAYCEHMGYEIDDTIIGKLDCIFNETYKCDANEFYNGLCGNDMIKELPLRKDGEKVYLEFEKCEDGLSIRPPKYLLDLPECYAPNFFNNVISAIKNFF